MLTGLYAKLIGAGAIIVAVSAAWMYVSGLHSDIEKLEQKLSSCISQGNVLSQKIIDQNSAVEAMKDAAAAREKAAAASLAAARAESVKAKERATIIYKEAPSTPGDDCKSTLDLINGVTQ